VEKAGNAEPQELAKALKGFKFESIAGPIYFRAIDNQSTLGYWIGRTTVKDGKGALKDWRYVPGEKYLFSEDEVRAARKQ
ncbi:MAG TPA: twin-arginine translocation pathway signal protein, partial [Pseudolabrys sp.]|nr:twin-arginine translocation pathway signal protein [Pseudolabrys sp.]